MINYSRNAGLPLERHDPLHDYLSRVVFPDIGFKVNNPVIDSVCLSNRQSVYLYHERKSDAVVVGKFFGNRSDNAMKNPGESLDQEYRNLHIIREKGFCNNPYRVVRPLGKVTHINFLLLEEYVRGHDLDYYIAKAVYEGQDNRLLKKLGYLGEFIAILHSITVPDNTFENKEALPDIVSVLNNLSNSGILSEKKFQRFKGLFNEWRQQGNLWYNRPVLIHGDATPTNFIFHHEDGVTAIDLERMRQSDRVYDIGMMSAELKHHFAWRILKADASEPFIEHFIRSYCDNLKGDCPTFKEISQKNRLFMAYGELRIARNLWLPKGHREWLISEAMRCMDL